MEVDDAKGKADSSIYYTADATAHNNTNGGSITYDNAHYSTVITPMRAGDSAVDTSPYYSLAAGNPVQEHMYDLATGRKLIGDTNIGKEVHVTEA